MLKIKLRAYFIALLLLVFMIGMIATGWLITTLGVLSFIAAVIIFIYFVFDQDNDMDLHEFIFGDD